MKYVYINDDFSTGSIVPGEDPVFPGVPVECRFSKEFLKKCVAVDDETEVKPGAKYDPDSKTFYVPEETQSTDEETTAE